MTRFYLSSAGYILTGKWDANAWEPCYKLIEGESK